MRVRFLAVGMLILGGFLCYLSLGPGGLAAAAAPPDADELEVVRQQQPVSTIPPLVQPPFSTIPPLATQPAPAPTSIPIPTPLPTRVIPPIPTPITIAPTVPPLRPAQAAPNAGGLPTNLLLLALGVSAATLGAGVYVMRSSRLR